MAQIPNFKAFLVAAKDDKNRFEYVYDLATQLGVQDHIIWSEKVPYVQLPNYILMADFTIVPSLVE